MGLIEEYGEIVTDIAILCKGATNWEIRGPEYAEKSELIGLLVLELARLHPNWFEEGQTILGRREGIAQLPYAETDPLFRLAKGSEALLWAWQGMRGANPSIDSLMRGVPEFTKALSSLLVGGRPLEEED